MHIDEHNLSTAVNGTTGESLSLTVEERKRVLEAWLKESAGRYHIQCAEGQSCLLL